jgi:ABC-type transporter Mla subunit MlaD
MALQDLTPQLRTRLSRMERAVGWFVILALALLTFGFVYYVYSTAERKGWFVLKAPYYTYTDEATGLKVGDPVTLMGFEAGEITAIVPMPAEQFFYNVYIEFELKWPNFEYMWTEGSRAKVATADLLGKRVLQVTKGTGGCPTYVFHPLRQVSVAEARSLPDGTNWIMAEEIPSPAGTNLLAQPKDALTNLDAIAASGCSSILIMYAAEKRKFMTGIWNDHNGRYDPYTKGSKYWLISDRSTAVTERLEKIVDDVQKALPNILSLTNELARVLANSDHLTSNLNAATLTAQPAVSNLAAIVAHLDQPGALGDWLLPTNLNRQLAHTLGSADSAMGTANATLANANTNLSLLVENLSRSLDNLANLTSNLNSQVQANTNMLSAISRAVVDTDDLVQGLKRHWLLRSAFRAKTTNAPPVVPPKSLRSPKD